jgi:hypothetical protein
MNIFDSEWCILWCKLSWNEHFALVLNGITSYCLVGKCQAQYIHIPWNQARGSSRTLTCITPHYIMSHPARPQTN